MILSAAALTEVRLARSQCTKVTLERGDMACAREMVVLAEAALRPVKRTCAGLCLASSTTISTPIPPVPMCGALVIIPTILK